MPRSLSMTGIVIDDLVALEQILENELHAPPSSLDSELRIAKALDGYKQANLLHNPDKGFMRETCSRFWGSEVDGMKGLLRGSSLRMWPLLCLTCRIGLLGFSTVKIDGDTGRMLGGVADDSAAVTLRYEHHLRASWTA